MMLPQIATCNHSAKFLANCQRRLKTEPFDAFFYHQSLENIEAIERLNPRLLVIGRNFGYVQNDHEFIEQVRSHASLATVPILLFLLETMPPPATLPPKVKLVWLHADFLNLEPLVATMHQLLSSSGTV
jgi:hypothetical protein